MTSLNLMQGYPGSGKTTVAKAWLLEGADHGTPRARVSRDALRAETFGGEGRLTHAQEEHITDLQQDAVRKLLKRGYDVVVDDMNLRRQWCVQWAGIALEQQVDLVMVPVYTDVETCWIRDGRRARLGGRHVGERTIREIAQKFPMGRWPTADDVLEAAAAKKSLKAGNWLPYDNPSHLPRVVLVDLDGTVALKDRADGARGWHEYHRVGEDLPNQPVIDKINFLYGVRYAEIVFMSGRKDSCREQTRQWLVRHVGPWTERFPLHMRDSADNRSDDIVKHELFDEHIRGKYHVVEVYDDRDRVVEMWRAIGLQVYQVAPGAF